MTPKIDFSKCSDNDVAELMFACYEPCRWLCKEQGHIEHDCERCPASNNMGTSACGMHGVAITKPGIASQCNEEILRLETPDWIKEIERQRRNK